MRLLLQRVKEAKVLVDGKVVGSIGKGILALFGAHQLDTIANCAPLADKMVNLRIFPDQEDKMNLSLKDVAGEALIVSQFTLYGDCSTGRRPSFSESAPPNLAIKLYEQFLKEVKERVSKVETGIFGAKMEVHLINDGPVTFLVESSEKKSHSA